MRKFREFGQKIPRLNSVHLLPRAEVAGVELDVVPQSEPDCVSLVLPVSTAVSEHHLPAVLLLLPLLHNHGLRYGGVYSFGQKVIFLDCLSVI